jgi:hypothetical protein
MSSLLKANSISAATGSTVTIPSGTTLDIASGATIDATGATATGFGSPAYASNASATDDTVNVDASDNLQFNSGYGSTATAYGCRAWVNFNGTGTVAIRDSGNVSSITDNGIGSYTVNFTTAMPDVNYCTMTTVATDNGGKNRGSGMHPTNSTVNLVNVFSYETIAQNKTDDATYCVAIFR